jgi:hypothetical protein
LTDDLENEYSRAILFEQIVTDTRTNDQENIYALRKLMEMLPEYIKSLFNVHGTNLMRMWGYDGEPILPPKPTEEKVGDKTVVKTLQIGNRIIKVLKKNE